MTEHKRATRRNASNPKDVSSTFSAPNSEVEARLGRRAPSFICPFTFLLAHPLLLVFLDSVAPPHSVCGDFSYPRTHHHRDICPITANNRTACRSSRLEYWLPPLFPGCPKTTTDFRLFRKELLGFLPFRFIALGSLHYHQHSCPTEDLSSRCAPMPSCNLCTPCIDGHFRQPVDPQVMRHTSDIALGFKAAESETQTDLLEIVGAQLPISSIAVQAFHAPRRCFLAPIKIFAVLLAAQ